MKIIKAVLFDLDGTLADTAPDLGAALNAMLEEDGKEALSIKAIRPVASHGARGLIALGYGIDVSDPYFPEYRARFLMHYERCLLQETRLFDGIKELILAISNRQLAWGIVTNKPARYTDPLVAWLPFPIAPGCVVSGDTCIKPKPDSAPMLFAAEKLGVLPEQCLYLGDAERDIEAGNKVGMPSLIANYGYIAETDTPEQWGAVASIDHPAQLLDKLNELI